jgi:hypothetical protein
LTVCVFLLEVAPLELQRRIVNDAVKDQKYSFVLVLCAAYLGAVHGLRRQRSRDWLMVT